ncbi:YfhJ family protein [Priestia endophytica]
MEDIFERLTTMLLEKNDSLSYAKARTWIELLWEDFEATSAKAGREYKGQELTEQIVTNWINHYGPRLHEFKTSNPKFKALMDSKDDLKH